MHVDLTPIGRLHRVPCDRDRMALDLAVSRDISAAGRADGP
jgi:hypothetical protein